MIGVNGYDGYDGYDCNQFIECMPQCRYYPKEGTIEKEEVMN